MATTSKLSSTATPRARRANRARAAVPGSRIRAPRAPRDELRKKARATRSSALDANYLSLYFREMAELEVLPPEAEFGAAAEIERLELEVWELLLSLPAMLPELREALVDHPQVSAQLASLPRVTPAKVPAAVARLAKSLRPLDEDRRLSQAALATAFRLVSGSCTRGAATEPSSADPTFIAWRRKLASADHAAHLARNEFVKANLRLVVSIARRFNHGRMALADLIQEGNLGLIKAVERYDYTKGFRFSTYASWWIRHAISRALADKGREVRLPVHMIDAQHRLAKARRQLTGELAREPTTLELANFVQMPVDKVEKMRTWMLEQAVPFDHPSGDSDGRMLAETLEDSEREIINTVDAMADEAMLLEISRLLGELRPIEADILRQRFGLSTEQELTLKEIGDKYNLSRERIRQLQEQALGKLRRAMISRDLM